MRIHLQDIPLALLLEELASKAPERFSLACANERYFLLPSLSANLSLPT